MHDDLQTSMQRGTRGATMPEFKYLTWFRKIDRQTDRHFSNESGSLESQYEELLKSALRLRRLNAHSARTALRGAMLALSGTGTMVSVIPRPVPWHQRLDNRRSPLAASQPKKKLHWRRRISQYHSTKRSDPESGNRMTFKVFNCHHT